MRFRTITYPILLIYEVFRLLTLLGQGSRSFSGSLPITWYSAAGMMVIPPVMFFLLTADEDRFASWLPLLSLIKAVSIPAFLVFLVKSIPLALSLFAMGDLKLAGPILAATLFIPADAFASIFCLRRNKKLCK